MVHLLHPMMGGILLADVVIQMLGTDYARILRAVYAFARGFKGMFVLPIWKNKAFASWKTRSSRIFPQLRSDKHFFMVLDEPTAECACYRSANLLLCVVGGCRVKVVAACLNGIKEHGCQLLRFVPVP
ncbi:uncharacterized protein LOC105640952 isoform X1 [Olea europaea subsp. europaea]|uniref:Uncharacterized protein LOC105640952 isoform X1 n=1 Tax=Olea europaea subsp. europaea TaxID=158383 RepID=A0A8S0TCV0_OLEEU|nr:uncharacterized protein LOC105640952 isoform X1 [Olea europaea subsp. europaea]